VTVSKERIPHADRPEARHHCKCVWVYSKNAAGEQTEHLYITHPLCPLHGDDAQPAPF
jgi:hypothetical protein